MCFAALLSGSMRSAPETTEEESADEAPLPLWALEFGERPVPLREAARLAGIGLTKAKEVIAAKPRLVRLRQASKAGGRPAPHVLPSELRAATSYDKKPTASARFVHRCRLAGVNPSQTLWRIVTGCLPDADKVIDAMRYAVDESVERGTPLFLKWVGGSAPLLYPERPALRHWLARRILRHGSRQAPKGSFEKVWRAALRKVERDGKLIRHLIPQKVEGGKWRLAEAPKYWETQKPEGGPAFTQVPGYAGERRLLDRQAKKLKAIEALGEMLLKSGSLSREVGLVSKATKLMVKAKPAPRFPAFEQARGRTIEDGATLKEREELDFHGSVGGLASLGADARAEDALTYLMATGLSKSRARTLLRAYWQRETKSFYGKPLSPSAVRQIFGMATRARTGKRPERRKKKPSRKSAR
jgi:hypothetical protein